jgi:hypothetical protein
MCEDRAHRKRIWLAQTLQLSVPTAGGIHHGQAEMAYHDHLTSSRGYKPHMACTYAKAMSMVKISTR